MYPTAKAAGFETLSAAIAAAGLEEVLTDEGPFTVFAPTDEAFAKLPEGTLESLLNDKEALKQVLLYHVVSGEVMASDVVKIDKAEMLNGQYVTINAKDGVMVNDAKVIKTDIKAENGVIHVIDTVLIPSSKS
ncbi:MAG: fasciclin domain-containing protein [Candidatus Latescibacterota bacterium]